MLDNQKNIKLKSLEKIEYFVSDNGQLFFNINKIEKNLKNHITFSKFLEEKKDEEFEKIRSVLHYDKFGFSTPKDYSENFFLNINGNSFVDYFITCVYIYQSNNEKIIHIQKKIFDEYKCSL